MLQWEQNTDIEKKFSFSQKIFVCFYVSSRSWAAAQWLHLHNAAQWLHLQPAGISYLLPVIFYHQFISFPGLDKLRREHSEISEITVALLTVDNCVTTSGLATPVCQPVSSLPLISHIWNSQPPDLNPPPVFLSHFSSPPSTHCLSLTPLSLSCLSVIWPRLQDSTEVCNFLLKALPLRSPPALFLNHFPLPPPSTPSPSLPPVSSVLLRECGSAEQGFCFKVQRTD